MILFQWNPPPTPLLRCVEKVFERLIFKRLFSFLQENNVLTSFQTGFIPSDSSVNQLTFLYNVFCKALGDGLEVRSVFFDISKAFDRVWHKGLLHKLKSTGVSGELLLWFKHYLTNHHYLFECPLYNHIRLPFSTNFVKSLVVSACKLAFLVTTPNL